MEVSIWSPDWGLASVDSGCLSMLAYAKFSGAPVTVKDTNSPFWSPNGKLPVFCHNSSEDANSAFENKCEITNFQSFVQHLRKSKFSADYNLTPKQCSEVAAFAQLMDEKLKPALLYAFWIDAKNLTELTRPWYAKKLGIPQCFYYPGKYISQASALIESRVGVSEDEVHQANVESAIYRDAQECLTILSRRLGETDPYFFGKAPSSADAIMYGYLAPLLKAPLPNSTPLQAHIRACDNLVSFVSKISLNYFPQASIDYEKINRANLASDNQNADQEHDSKEFIPKKSLSEKARPVIVSSFAVAAMLGYAHLTGLLGLFKDLNITSSNRITDETDSDDEND